MEGKIARGQTAQMFDWRRSSQHATVRMARMRRISREIGTHTNAARLGGKLSITQCLNDNKPIKLVTATV